MEGLREKLSTLLFENDRSGFSRLIESSGFPINRINTEDLVYRPLVHWTLFSDSFEWFVNNYNPDLNVVDDEGKSVIFYGIEFFKHEAFILSRGVNIHLRDSNNDSPVMLAAKVGNSRIVCALLDRGASLKDAYAGFERRRIRSSFFDVLKGNLDSYYVCQEACRKAVISILALKKRKMFQHDMLTLMAKMVWSTKREEEWKTE